MLISISEPESRWFAHTAMDRNKLVYALGDAALVVASAADGGGTWSGATEALRHGRTPIYVKASDEISEGNQKLLSLGARPFPQSWKEIKNLFVPIRGESVPPMVEPSIVLHVEKRRKPRQKPGNDLKSSVKVDSDERLLQPSSEMTSWQHTKTDTYGIILPSLLATLSEPRTEQHVQESLGIVSAQAKAWLRRALEEGLLDKLNRPVRYVAVHQNLCLFPVPIQTPINLESHGARVAQS